MPSPQQFVVRHPWLTALLALLALWLGESGALRGQAFVQVADLLQLAIMVAMLVGTAINVRITRGHVRGFWTLMTVSAAMWSVDYALWVYHEVIRRSPMPVPQVGDTFLILHVIPVIMALAMFPHRRQKEDALPSSNLEFPLIVCWWLYLYFQFVFVWHYLDYDAASFHRNFNLLYHAELAIVIVALFYLSKHSSGRWQQVYQHYLVAFLIYAPTSAIINILIQQHAYTSGGLWDIPLTVSIAYLAWVGFHAYRVAPEPTTPPESVRTGLSTLEWMASLVVASIPAMALFSFARMDDPWTVRYFRVILGFTAMLLIAVLVFTRQYRLNRRLAQSLTHAEEAFNNLERLQTQVMQSEKLASLGRLVSGAAHELNNPLAAILGYAELIADDQAVPAAQRGFADKIVQQARRTKNLVSNLLSFARQTPAQKRLTDLNLLVNNACQLQLASLPASISLTRNLQADLPHVVGDDNHLLQVFLQVLNNAIDAVQEAGGGEIDVRTYSRGEQVLLEVRDNGPGITDPARVFDPFYTTKPPGHGSGLGLSACYGIIQDHGGTIECSNLAPHGAVFRITLKAASQPAPSEVAAVR